jgi:hypothetical protein
VLVKAGECRISAQLRQHDDHVGALFECPKVGDDAAFDGRGERIDGALFRELAHVVGHLSVQPADGFVSARVGDTVARHVHADGFVEPAHLFLLRRHAAKLRRPLQARKCGAELLS